MKCTNLKNIISLFSGEDVNGYFMSIHEVNIKYYLFGLFLLALLRINKKYMYRWKIKTCSVINQINIFFRFQSQFFIHNLIMY